MKKLPKINTSELLKAALPYILVGLMATKLGQAYRMASGGDVLDRIFGAFLKIGEAFTNPLPSLHPFDLLVGAACGALLWFIVYQKSKNARKYRRGAEYGTARWGNAKDIEPFIDPDFSQNILLSETERLTLGKIADPEKRNVNLNVLVIGGSGSGKTRYHIKPNLLQMNASYVCSDPKGTVIEEVGRALVRGGYKIYKIGIGFGHGDMATVHSFMTDLYFESAGMILTLITLGKTLEARAKGKTSDAITKLMNLVPKTATVERDGQEIQVPVEDVQLGETLIVKAGESVPVDGIVIEGFSSVDESALTGESIPVEKHIGDKVIGATTSKSGYFKIN